MSKTSLEKFKSLNVEIKYEDIIDKYSTECAEDIKRLSPKKSGKYADGWTTTKLSRKSKGVERYGVRVYNATSYQLTHLLENGHLIVNKIGGVGWASAKPHIDPAFQSIKQPFIRAMENANIDVEIK